MSNSSYLFVMVFGIEGLLIMIWVNWCLKVEFFLMYFWYLFRVVVLMILSFFWVNIGLSKLVVFILLFEFFLVLRVYN